MPARVLTRLRASPWPLALLLGAVQMLHQAVSAATSPLERFDQGIELASITFTQHGLVALADYYQPYGIGLGIPGAVLDAAGFHGLLAERIAYGAFSALATALAVVAVSRLTGDLLLGTLAGVASLASGVARYSMCWCAIFGFALLMARAYRQSGGRDLQAAIDAAPGTALAAGLVLSLAGWARVEYAVPSLVWTAILIAGARSSRDGRRLIAVQLAATLLPSAIVVAAGGLEHYWAFAHYSLTDFRARRGSPIEWSAAVDWARDLAHLRPSSDNARIVGTYGLGAVVLAAAVVMVVRARRSAFTAVEVLLLAVAAFALYANSVRFSPGYGVIASAPVWVAAALLAARAPRVVALVVPVLLLPALVHDYAPNRLLEAPKVGRAIDVTFREVVPGIRTIPLRDREWQSLAALPVLWTRGGHAGSPTLTVSQHNDVADFNEPFVHWLLDAGPAAWPTTYDPGLGDRVDIQRDTVHSLCANGAPVVQSTEPEVNWRTDQRLRGPVTLDAHLAVNTRVEAVAGFYRILVRRPGPCRDAMRMPSADLAARRDELLSVGDLPGAGALAMVLAQRRRGDADDAAVALLGAFVPASDDLPAGAAGDALRSLRDDRAAPGLTRAAGARRGNDHVLLAAHTAWLAQSGGSPAEREAVVRSIVALLRRHPDWPAALEQVLTVIPTTPATTDALVREGVTAPALLGPRIDAAVGARRYAAAGSIFRAARGQLRDDPVALGALADRFAAALTNAGEPGCAERVRRLGDALPGVRLFVNPADPAACSVGL